MIAELTAEAGEIRSEIDVARHQAIACVRKAEEDAQAAEFEYNSLEKMKDQEMEKLSQAHMEIILQSQGEQAGLLARERMRADRLAEQIKSMNEELDHAADESAQNEKRKTASVEVELQQLRDQHETDEQNLISMRTQLQQVREVANEAQSKLMEMVKAQDGVGLGKGSVVPVFWDQEAPSKSRSARRTPNSSIAGPSEVRGLSDNRSSYSPSRELSPLSADLLTSEKATPKAMNLNSLKLKLMQVDTLYDAI